MYNRIHNDYDTNVVRVELNSSYRPRQHSITRNRVSSREVESSLEVLKLQKNNIKKIIFIFGWKNNERNIYRFNDFFF